MSVDHYENFPVASWLCPARLRPPIVAIYHFARTADDIADEGSALPEARALELQDYRAELHRVASGAPPQARWAHIFRPLSAALKAFALPVALLDDLLDAFLQDTGNPLYDSRADLLDYCRRSAQPIGRLLLHLYGIDDDTSLARSDALCSALQLINFWQDLSVDHARGRCYLPEEDARRHGVDRAGLLAGHLAGPAEQALLGSLLAWAADLLHEGAPLALQVPGRAGWELRLVVQGGRRILERITAMNPASFRCRPALTGLDLPVMLWRSLTMARS